MKKFMLAVLMVFIGVSVSEASNILIAYFSRSGNTQKVAEYVASALSSDKPDIFRITTAEPYPEDYNETTRKAQEEQNNNARPVLSGDVEDMSKYDVVFLGYPIWWGTVPMAVYTFLEGYDFSGKRIIPFNTHAGSGKGRSISDINAAVPDAEVGEGFAVRGADAESSGASVAEWVNGLNVISGEPADTGTETKQPENEQTENTAGSSSSSSSGGCGMFSGTLLLCAIMIPCRKFAGRSEE